MVDEEDADLFDEQLQFEYGTDRERVYYTPDVIWVFLRHIVQQENLPIEPILKKLLNRDSFFLVAATGLGKTLTVPLWLLFRHMYYPDMRPSVADEGSHIAAESPRVWVVEPKIAICQGLAAFLNGYWENWCAAKTTGDRLPLFGCKTRADHTFVEAPIVFITTGIFSIYAHKGRFRPGRDIVLIDEAHDTLESDEGVELGTAICRNEGVDINYMSATVDVSNLPRSLGVRVIQTRGARQPTWRHNTKQTMDECIVDLVRNTLIDPNPASEYFPPRDVQHTDAILRAALEQNRAKGILVIVNSFTGAQSDAKRIERLLREAFATEDVEISMLASEVLRDAKRKAAYERTLKRWETQKKRYVLIATSVVEMGVTLPDLDFVVTMDSSLEETASGLAREHLSVNSLIQRIGRVGRERPGIAYITCEAGAPYSNLDDTALNAPGALAPERIRFPMREGSLTALAYYAFEHGWSLPIIEARLKRRFHLPSYQEAPPGWLDRLQEERNRLVALGVATKNPYALTAKGVEIERWIGRADIQHALAAQRAFHDQDMFGIFSALCECALFEVPLNRIFQKEDSDEEQKRSTRFSLLLVFILNHSASFKLRSNYSKQEQAEKIAEFLMQNEGRWNWFVQFLVALTEAMQILHDSNKVSERDAAPLVWLKDWRKALLAFIRPP